MVSADEWCDAAVVQRALGVCAERLLREHALSVLQSWQDPAVREPLTFTERDDPKSRERSVYMRETLLMTREGR